MGGHQSRSGRSAKEKYIRSLPLPTPIVQPVA